MTTLAPASSPWASGPGEILGLALELLRRDTDSSRRLAMISIDNAVELMIKTYLHLPKRVTGLVISRKERDEISENFPSLLDGLEKHASGKILGIDLGAIEWYHGLRNELYHEGNGLTIERDKAEVYAELANQLFRNLFGVSLVQHVTPSADLLGEFISLWSDLEAGLEDLASTVGRSERSPVNNARFLVGTGLVTDSQVKELEALRRIRNDVLHGREDHRVLITPAIVARLRELVELFPEDG